MIFFSFLTKKSLASLVTSYTSLLHRICARKKAQVNIYNCHIVWILTYLTTAVCSNAKSCLAPYFALADGLSPQHVSAEIRHASYKIACMHLLCCE